MSEEVRHGIPSYDGTPEKLARLREEALQRMLTLECHKRRLAGNSTDGHNQGSGGRKLAQDPRWLAHPPGAYVLVDSLEQHIE